MSTLACASLTELEEHPLSKREVVGSKPTGSFNVLRPAGGVKPWKPNRCPFALSLSQQTNKQASKQPNKQHNTSSNHPRAHPICAPRILVPVAYLLRNRCPDGCPAGPRQVPKPANYNYADTETKQAMTTDVPETNVYDITGQPRVYNVVLNVLFSYRARDETNKNKRETQSPSDRESNR